MTPAVKQALKLEAHEKRSQGTMLIAHSDQILEVLRQADQLASFSVKPEPVSATAGSRPVYIKLKQAEAIAMALKKIGGAAPVQEIADVIKREAWPVRSINLDNLRSAMSRSPKFASYGSGKWWFAMSPPPQGDGQQDLAGQTSSRNGTNGRDHTDLSDGEQNRGSGA